MFNLQSNNLNQSTLFTSNSNNLLSTPNTFSAPESSGLLFVNSPNDVPKDSVEYMEFSPMMPSIFAAISWDCTLRIYEIGNGQIVQKNCLQLPAYPLSMAWRPDGNAVYISLSDNTIQLADFSMNNLQKFSDCAATVHKLKSAPSINGLIGFDMSNKINVYMQGNPGPVFSLQLKYAVMDVDISDYLVLIIMADSYSTIIDLHSLNQYSPTDLVYTESQLKSPLSACAINSKTLDFVLASVDGRAQKSVASTQGMPPMGSNKRVFVSGFNQGNNQLNFVFIAHSAKSKDGNTSDMFETNNCGFNARSDNFLFTTGSDGMLNFWDLKAKNKITSIPLGNSVTACAINKQGNYAAFATGYDWGKGVWGLSEVNYKPKIGVRLINDNELVYKPTGLSYR